VQGWTSGQRETTDSSEGEQGSIQNANLKKTADGKSSHRNLEQVSKAKKSIHVRFKIAKTVSDPFPPVSYLWYEFAVGYEVPYYPFALSSTPTSLWICFQSKLNIPLFWAETGSLLPRAREQGLENLKPVLHKTKKTTKMKMMMSPKPEDFAVTSTPKNWWKIFLEKSSETCTQGCNLIAYS
jgi:hypothetical protein